MTLYQRQLEEKQGSAPKTAEDKPAADSFTISGDAAKMKELLQVASLPPEVRTGQVQELKDAIARGQYFIDSKKISAALLDQQK